MLFGRFVNEICSAILEIMKTTLRGLIIGVVTIVAMVALIPIVQSDMYLSGIYVLVILVSLKIYREEKDVLLLVAGLVFMTISEYCFISTGVETFLRTSLFGVMPIWLPILWGYGFVAISRVIKILVK